MPPYGPRVCRVDDPASAALVTRLDAFLAVGDGEEHASYADHDRGDTLDDAVVLEAEARGRGYRKVVLETGVRQPAAIRLYEREGYRRIPAYPPYAAMADSVCYALALA